jgi:hypothetical protein
LHKKDIEPLRRFNIVAALSISKYELVAAAALLTMRAGPSHFTQKLLPLNINAATTINTSSRFHRTSSYFFLQPYPMAESVGTSNIPAPHPIQPKPNSEAEKKEIPPPPEKPDSGDCCGSGCVRCVWDIYYDELEEYNKLYKQEDPKSKP